MSDFVSVEPSNRTNYFYVACWTANGTEVIVSPDMRHQEATAYADSIALAFNTWKVPAGH